MSGVDNPTPPSLGSDDPTGDNSFAVVGKDGSIQSVRRNAYSADTNAASTSGAPQATVDTDSLRAIIARRAPAHSQNSVTADRVIFADTPSEINMKLMRFQMDEIYNNIGQKDYSRDGIMGCLGSNVVFRSMPATWPEPYVPYSVTLAKKSDADTEKWWEDKASPMAVVGVDNSKKFIEAPTYSNLAQTLLETSKLPVSDRTAQTSMALHPTGQIDIGSAMKLLAIWARTTSQKLSQDQAPLLRAYLMSMTFTDPEILDGSSSLGQNMTFSSDAMVSDNYSVSKVALAKPESLLVPHSTNTTKVNWIPLGAYRALFDGTLSKYKEVDLNILSKAVVIPLMTHDLHADWLVLYAASYTTTKWWNGGVKVKSVIPDSDDKMTTWTSPVACDVLVDGQYYHIVFVVLDVGNATPTVKFGTYEGPFDDTFTEGAREIYKALGMYDDSTSKPDWNMREAVIHAVCRYTGTGDIVSRVEYMVSELCFRYFMGYGVLTKKERGQWSGPMTVRNDVIKIGSEAVPTYSTWNESAPEHFRFIRDWRVSAMGLFPAGEGLCNMVPITPNTDIGHRTTSIANPTPSYTVTQLDPLERILVGLNLFLDSEQCGGFHMNSELDFFRHKQFVSAFMAMNASWWYLQSGIPITDMCGLSKFGNANSTRTYRGIMNLITLGFINPNIGVTRSRYLHPNSKKLFKSKLGLEAKKLDFDSIRSLHVPYYAVFAYIQKMMGSDKTVPSLWKPERFDLVSGGTRVTRNSFPITTDDPHWMKLASLTSTIGYEIGDSEQRSWFPIELSDSEFVRIEPTITCWYPYPAIDNFRPDWGQSGETWDKYTGGLVTLLAVVNATHRMPNVRSAVVIQSVSSQNRTGGITGGTIEADLSQPDPFLKWLAGKGLVILPSLAAGNLPGAMSALLASLSQDIMEWLFRAPASSAS